MSKIFFNLIIFYYGSVGLSIIAYSFLIREKGREPDVRETGEELGGIKGGVTVIKIYLLNKEKVKKSA